MKVMYGFLAFGGLAGLTLLVIRLLSGDSKILDALKKTKVDQLLKKNKVATQKQNEIVMRVVTDEEVGEAVKVEIEEIQKRAKKDIDNALKRNNIKETTAQIQTLWKEI